MKTKSCVALRLAWPGFVPLARPTTCVDRDVVMVLLGFYSPPAACGGRAPRRRALRAKTADSRSVVRPRCVVEVDWRESVPLSVLCSDPIASAMGITRH